jgi:hypothetical protein
MSLSQMLVEERGDLFEHLFGFRRGIVANVVACDCPS